VRTALQGRGVDRRPDRPTEATITEHPKKDAPQMPGGGGGGMGGMDF